VLTFRWDEAKPVEDKPVLDNNAIHPPTLVHNMPTDSRAEEGYTIERGGQRIFQGEEF
jgi:hypothetical protein